MKVYADTSWWIASKCRGDVHHSAALDLFDSEPFMQVCWTPWQRVEVFNSLRQAERAGLLQPREARTIIRLVEQEVRLGYWPHREFDWTNAVRTSCELSAEHSLTMAARGMDLFHVAVAIEIGADGFLTFDDDQKELARAAGVPLVEIG